MQVVVAIVLAVFGLVDEELTHIVKVLVSIAPFRVIALAEHGLPVCLDLVKARNLMPGLLPLRVVFMILPEDFERLVVFLV